MRKDPGLSRDRWVGFHVSPFYFCFFLVEFAGALVDERFRVFLRFR